MSRLWIDLETYCEVPITCGTYVCASAAEVMLVAWAVGDAAAQVWDVTAGGDMPPALRAALDDEQVEVWAHNSQFDRVVWRHAMAWSPQPALHRWRDTMVQAYLHSLPGSLGELCAVLKVQADKAKDADGRRLVQLFCKPLAANRKLRRATSSTHPAEWARFVEYARLDVEAMREVHRRLPAWNYKGTELDLWHLDQKVNDRGVQIDMALVHGALAAIGKAQLRNAADTWVSTGGALDSTTQREATLEYISNTFGVVLDDLQGPTVDRLLADPNLAPELRELLNARVDASTTSTAKYKALAKATNRDGRLRGTLQFCGAGRTGRWAGRVFQPQNLPRPVLKQDQIDQAVEAFRAGRLPQGNPIRAASDSLRGCIVARPGRKLVVADLSNIEGRDQAWLCGEDWKLEAFRDFDAGVGPDLYKLAYSKSFGVDVADVTKDNRQVGKVQELALGYEGGVGAFVTFAAAYAIDLEQLAPKVLPVADATLIKEAERMWDWTLEQNRPTHGLSKDAFVACDVIKRGWRRAHPAIASYWGELRDAVMLAINSPGKTYECRRLKVRRDGAWLRIGLPSGRALCYPSPAVSEDGKITYSGVNQYSRKWSRLGTYGGKLFENVCQAVARDVMGHNMPLIEAAGYEIVLTVHDEVICEAPDSSEYSADGLAALLSANPPWAPDMPLAAAGFETDRYKKD